MQCSGAPTLLSAKEATALRFFAYHRSFQTVSGKIVDVKIINKGTSIGTLPLVHKMTHKIDVFRLFASFMGPEEVLRGTLLL